MHRNCKKIRESVWLVQYVTNSSQNCDSLKEHRIQLSNPYRYNAEEAQEASNKLIRRFREHSFRKMNRKVTMEDVLHRPLANSDPLIAFLSEEKNNQKRVRDII